MVPPRVSVRLARAMTVAAFDRVARNFRVQRTMPALGKRCVNRSPRRSSPRRVVLVIVGFKRLTRVAAARGAAGGASAEGIPAGDGGALTGTPVPISPAG
jgi:hypothetical protein